MRVPRKRGRRVSPVLASAAPGTTVGSATVPAARLPLTRAAEPAPVRRRGRWQIVAAKEFADHLLSVRFLVLVVILGLAAAGAVYAAASAIRDVASDVAGQPSLFLKLFTVAPEERFPPFYVLVGFLGPLLGIAFGFDAVNGERAERTLPRLLSQPIHRDDVINGKFAAGLGAIGLILVAITLIVAAIGILQLGVMPTPEELLRLAVWLILASAYVGLWLAFALLCSVLLRRAATSALVAISVWLVLTLFAALVVGVIAAFVAPLPNDPSLAQELANLNAQQELARLSPGRLYEEATAAILDPSVRTVGLVLAVQVDRAVGSILPLDQSLLVVWPQFVALIALTAAAFALAYISFMRQEVRA